MICNHHDLDYKRACFDAYNRWIAEFCSAHPERLLGLGQTAMRTPEEGIDDLQAIKALGLRGVMLPGEPAVEATTTRPSTTSSGRRPSSSACRSSFHILTTEPTSTRPGPKMNDFLTIVRGCQDVHGMLVLGGVFERHPDLRVVCVEADAGWVPHFMYRMDHAYKRHRYWLPAGQELDRLPSEYFAENIYITFQDDWSAFRMRGRMNWRRLMWANDFPHSDSTWPWSQEMLAEHTRSSPTSRSDAILSEQRRRALRHRHEGADLMAFPGIAHVAVTVKDLDVSRPWYERLFGASQAVLDEDAGSFHHVVWMLDGGTLFGIHLQADPQPGEYTELQPRPRPRRLRRGQPRRAREVGVEAQRVGDQNGGSVGTRPTARACRSATPTTSPWSSSHPRGDQSHSAAIVRSARRGSTFRIWPRKAYCLTGSLPCSASLSSPS